MISAIGVSYLLQNLALYITGGLAQIYPSIPLISNTITIGSATTKVVTLVTPVLTIVLVIALMQLINHTKIGMAMRAVANDFETSRLMGIKVDNVISMTFIIGSFLAAIGSLLYFSNYPEFERCLEYMRAHPEEAGRMGQNGGRYVREHFAWDTIVRNYRAFFDRIAEKRE